MHKLLKNIGIHQKSFIIIFICFIASVYFITYSIFGKRGIIDYFQIKNKLEEKSLESDKLFTKIKNKENLVKRMKNESLDLDLLDEEIRRNGGQANKNEIIIFDTNIQQINSDLDK